jgi:tetratricopeptide (TPR) repeat protein
MANIYSELGKNAKTLEYADRAIEVGTKYNYSEIIAEAELAKAEILTAEGRPEDAARLLEEAEKKCPDHRQLAVSISLARAAISQAKGDSSGAEALFRSVIGQLSAKGDRGDLANALFKYANFLAATGKPDGARDKYAEAEQMFGSISMHLRAEKCRKALAEI